MRKEIAGEHCAADHTLKFGDDVLREAACIDGKGNYLQTDPVANNGRALYRRTRGKTEAEGGATLLCGNTAG